VTREEWLALQVGDVVIDHKCGGARRVVRSIRRVTSQRGQRTGATRTVIRVDNLKTRGELTVIFSTDDSPGYSRFSLERAT